MKELERKPFWPVVQY